MLFGSSLVAMDKTDRLENLTKKNYEYDKQAAKICVRGTCACCIGQVCCPSLLYAAGVLCCWGCGEVVYGTFNCKRKKQLKKKVD